MINNVRKRANFDQIEREYSFQGTVNNKHENARIWIKSTFKINFHNNCIQFKLETFLETLRIGFSFGNND